MGVWCLYRLCGCMVLVDCHALSCAKARNDGDLGGFKKVDSMGVG